MLNFVMLSVILLSVAAPLNHTFAFVVSNGGKAFSALSFLNHLLSLLFSIDVAQQLLPYIGSLS